MDRSRLTIRTVVGLERELAQVRKNGYAIDDQEYEEGLKCIGAPILDHTGSVVAALSIAGPAMRLRPERMPSLIEAVFAAAAHVSTALGYRSERDPRPSPIPEFHFLKPDFTRVTGKRPARKALLK